MSYILDALRRSERERRPGAAPARDPGPALLPPSRIALYAIPIGAAAAAGVGLYLIFGRPAADPVPAAAEKIEAPADAAVSAAPAKPAPRLQEPAAPPATSAPKPATAPNRVRNLAEQTRIPAPPKPAAEPALPGTVMSAAPAARARGPFDGVKLLRAMPPDFQRALPELVVNIHVYAPNEAERILYINNREYHAGDKVQDDIFVEQIVEDGAVLSFRGQRFKLPRPS